VWGIEPILLDVGRALRFSVTRRIWKLVLPAALPSIAVGLRLAAGIAIVVPVTVEIAANPWGLGYGMITAQQSLRADLTYAQLLWIGVVGWLLNAVLVRTERRWLAWFWTAREAAR
jgi:NitT/TauT family transport system permease protein